MPKSAIIRNDTGVFEGGEISMYYDPMIAKLCTWGEDRGVAIGAMREALDVFELEGIGHNIPFLQAVYDHERFERGDITTAFIADEYPDGLRLSSRMNILMDLRALRLILDIAAKSARSARSCMTLLSIARRAFQEASRTMNATCQMNGRSKSGSNIIKLSSRLWSIISRLVLRRYLSQKVIMFGIVGVSSKWPSAVRVQDGQALAVVEAMKMENTLRAEKKSVVSKINAQAGDNLI